MATGHRNLKAAAIWPEFDLADQVAEVLLEEADRDGSRLIVMYVLGECAGPDGERMLSTMIDASCASISFVHDLRGTFWLTWQDFARSSAGARRIGPSEDVDGLAKYCCSFLTDRQSPGPTAYN